MGKKAITRVTEKDIANEGGLDALLSEAVKNASSGGEEAMEIAASKLACLAEQNHSAHADALVATGAVPALVHVLAHGDANALASAAKALHFIAHTKPAHQRRLPKKYGSLASTAVDQLQRYQPTVKESVAKKRTRPAAHAPSTPSLFASSVRFT